MNARKRSSAPAPGEREGPIVIGALGGSGTRAIAQALSALGVYMGGKLNPAHDNLWFTLLIKRPRWLPERLAGPRPAPDITAALQLLDDLMAGVELDRERIGMLADAAADMATWGHDDRKARKGPGAFRIPASALQKSKPPATPWWGWKEPHSHLVLPELVANFPALRYAHVLRHPLDMAFSDNKTDLRLFGPSFGVEAPEDGIAAANAQLRWWVKAADMAAENGASLGRRFAFVRFEQLCQDPVDVLGNLCEAFELPATPGELARAAAHVETPASTGRWRSHPWHQLDPELVAAAGRYGFDVPDVSVPAEGGVAS